MKVSKSRGQGNNGWMYSNLTMGKTEAINVVGMVVMMMMKWERAEFLIMVC